MRLPDGEGLEIVRYITEHCPQTPVAVITAFGSAGNAVAALKAGTLERGEASVDHKPRVSTKSRAQVAAEGREALRLGVVGHGEGPAPVLTPAQAESIRMAGLQAASQWLATR